MRGVKAANKLKLKLLGIDTQHEHIAFIRADSQIIFSEGFEALTRIRLIRKNKSIVASLNIVYSDLLKDGEIGLSESAISSLHAKAGDEIIIRAISPIESLRFVRAKIYGNEIDTKAMKQIVDDIVEGRYGNVQLSAFITACAGNRLNTDEIISLTKAMINSGNRIRWGKKLVVDKHSIGGLPGNRTTPIVVAIVTAFGLTMPKTSSRAITSPAGTADTMETITEVNLTKAQIRKVVEAEGACLAWGGHANLSPADDILIRVERALDLDSEGQMIASVLSKKVSAGSTHVIIDMPVGETAKIRSIEAANALKVEMEKVAHAIKLNIKVVITDGTQPVGRGLGPALEAMDVLSVLRNEEIAPVDLRDRALLIAGEIIELSGKTEKGEGNKIAKELLESGKAFEKFKAICEAQGRFTEPEYAKYKHEVKAKKSGIVININNRRLAKVAKLAGAPDDPSAGIEFLAPIGTKIETGQILFNIYAEAKGELAYALDYLQNEEGAIITIE